MKREDVYWLTGVLLIWGPGMWALLFSTNLDFFRVAIGSCWVGASFMSGAWLRRTRRLLRERHV